MSEAVASTQHADEVRRGLFDVAGARVVVTGAASGLGSAMAEVLADCGARVTLVDVDADGLEQATQELRDRGGDVRADCVDVADRDAVERMVSDAAAAYGGLDVCFANAGIGRRAGFAVDDGERLDTIDRDVWDRVLDINLTGAVTTMRAAAEIMRPQGSGRIIATASVAGLAAETMAPYSYAASKAGLVNVVRLAALDLAPDGVLVNVICPGPFRTRIGTGKLPDESMAALWKPLVPLGRMADTEELKGLVLLLSSPAGSYITGAAIVIDGGMVTTQHT